MASDDLHHDPRGLGQATLRGGTDTPGVRADELDALLAQRGQAARQIIDVETARIKLVIFVIGETSLALRARNLLEILPFSTPHFVPGCPPVIEGVIDVRGDIASVLRLGDLLGLAHAPPERGGAILLGEAHAVRSGLRVDRVIDVFDLAEEAIQPPPDSLRQPLRDFTSGVFEHQGEVVILLELEQIFRALVGSMDGA
ncbi:chemotaxis protein CheW [Thiocapsa imhoffii]|uniref:Chemotaxis protein CheW n=1 Tax=Thiocapsa imhoffii TaxID=382777 RepID=A0A9X1BB61_9GAMM|nr:chemotaxis protein CheW [Thiocapsa imhoffii]MBK1646638.1 chemotaxis protein CheW [Thiocapsa imhoffii]